MRTLAVALLLLAPAWAQTAPGYGRVVELDDALRAEAAAVERSFRAVLAKPDSKPLHTACERQLARSLVVLLELDPTGLRARPGRRPARELAALARLLAALRGDGEAGPLAQRLLRQERAARALGQLWLRLNEEHANLQEAWENERVFAKDTLQLQGLRPIRRLLRPGGLMGLQETPGEKRTRKRLELLYLQTEGILGPAERLGRGLRRFALHQRRLIALTKRLVRDGQDVRPQAAELASTWDEPPPAKLPRLY